MKKAFVILLMPLVLLSCEKDNNEPKDTNTTDPYELPWKTEFIRYENTSMCIGSHSSGYKLYYKDSLILTDCIQLGGISISDLYLLNDSTLYIIFTSSKYGCSVITTQDGGYSWIDTTYIGPPNFIDYYPVSNELFYCVTRNQNDLFFTGIGKSDLSLYQDYMAKGTHYILDNGTNIIDSDSTLITLNDTVRFVIKFAE